MAQSSYDQPAILNSYREEPDINIVQQQQNSKYKKMYSLHEACLTNQKSIGTQYLQQQSSTFKPLSLASINTKSADTKQLKILFEKNRIIEFLRFSFILISCALNFIQFDLSFNRNLNLTNQLLVYLIFCHTILIEFFTVLAFHSQFHYRQLSGVISEMETFIGSDSFKAMIIQLILFIPHPNPFFSDLQIREFDSQIRDNKVYYLNEVMSYLMLSRLVIAFEISFKFSSYYSNQVSRIWYFIFALISLSHLYSVDLSTFFILKCQLKSNPYITQSLIFILGSILFAFSFRVSEWPLEREDSDSIYTQYSTAFWVSIVTVPSVGYGDLYPYTSLGRIAMGLCVLWGLTISSMFILSFLKNISLTTREENAIALVERLESSKKMQYLAGEMIRKIAQLYSMKQNKGQLQSQAQLLRGQFIKEQRDFKKTERQRKLIYRHIDGENELAMMNRYFKTFRLEAKEFIQKLGFIQEKQILIKEKTLRQEQDIPSELKKFDKEIINERKSNIASKDEAFFDNLIQKNTNLGKLYENNEFKDLINFEDDENEEEQKVLIEQ